MATDVHQTLGHLMRDGRTTSEAPRETRLVASGTGAAAEAIGDGTALVGARSRRTTLLAWLTPGRVSALYVWIALIAIFAIWVPDTFLTTTNLKVILSSQAITAIVAVGLTVALAAGVLDLAVASTLGLCGILAALLIANDGVPWGAAVVLCLLCGASIGAINALLIAGLGISSIIATLGMSSVLGGLVVAVSGNQDVVGLNAGFTNLGSESVLGIALPVWIMLGVAAALWFVLEHTPGGRYIHASGAGLDAARLSGVRTTRWIAVAAMVSATVAALAGVLGTARIGAGDPQFGPPYLLAAFAAAFLGSTQLKPGRFNVWGTVLAVYVLATGVQGLELAGAPTWLPSVFNGVVLLIAVGITTGRERVAAALVRLRLQLRRAYTRRSLV
jgi:ribose transport system permease protein